MKLHIGCGKRKIHGWCNVDIDPQTKPDVVDDAIKLEAFVDDSVSIIYASHILEHNKRHDIMPVLITWYKKLMPGGLLRISVPDFAKVVHAYNLKTPLSVLMGFLVGGQKTHYDNHHIVFDFELISNCLVAAGFENVREYDWRTTEHFYVDDYASAYLPHMDKGSGLLMSLNIEADKPLNK